MPAKRKSTRKRLKSKTAPRKKPTAKRKTASSAKKPARKRKRTSSRAFSREESTTRTGRQSGDLQGLSGLEHADSESVDELLEEGNAFEAGVVAGVEEADDADEREVHTREVPEDDVPDEYLDKDI